MNLSRNKILCVLLSYKFFFRPFLITSCFCSSRFEFTSCFISFFVWPFIFLIAIFFGTISPSFVSQNVQLIPFWMHALPLYVLLLMDLFICCLFLFSSCFLVSITCVSLFPVFSVHNLSAKTSWRNCCKSEKKNLFVYFPFCFFFSYLFCLCMFVCFFSKFLFFVLFSCVFEHSSFKFSFLNVFSSVTPFYVSHFLEDSVWFDHRISFFSSSPFTYSPFFTRSHVFWIVSVRTVSFLFEKTVFLVCWSLKNVPLCFLFLLVFFSSQEKLENDDSFYFFLTFFFELSTFFNTNSVGKTSCFVFFGLFSFSVFLSSVFSCRFLFDFSRSPSQHASFSKMSSLPLYFLLLFILFPSVLSFLSPLVFSFLSPFLPF